MLRVLLVLAIFSSVVLFGNGKEQRAWPVSDRMIGFWPLTAEHTVKDIGPHNYDGAPQTQAFTTGPFGSPQSAAMPTSKNTKILRVDSSNVSVVDSSFTVSLFFKRGGLASSGGIFEFLDKASYKSTKAFQFRYENATTFELSANSVTIGHISMVEQNSEWTYIALVYNNTDTTLAVYGKSGLILEPTVKPQLKLSLAYSNNGIRVGYSTRFAQGLSTSDAVACLMIYATALTSDEVFEARDACRYVSGGTLSTQTPTTTGAPTILELQHKLKNAAISGDVEKVRQLLELGILDVNWRASDGRECFGFACVYNAPILIHATHRNPSNVFEIVRLLVEHGADVNATEHEDRFTALIFAAHYGQLETVRFLLDQGANVRAKTGNNGWTALKMAADWYFLDIVRLLLDRGAPNVPEDLEAIYGYLRESAKNGKVDLVRKLLELNALDVNWRDENDYSCGYWECVQNGTALLHAVCGNPGNLTEIVQLLLDNGADVNAKQMYRSYTALFYVARNGKVDIVRKLLDRGADVNEKADEGYTALMWAAWENEEETIQVLLDRGAEIEWKTVNGETALMRAAQFGSLKAVKLLVDRGANINVKLKNGNSILMEAAKFANAEVVSFLLSRGASREGCTPDFSPLCAITIGTSTAVPITLKG